MNMKDADGEEESAGPLRLLDKVAVVLVAPKYPENIGAAARVAANMGIKQLMLVRCLDPDQERMRKMATHHAGAVIDSISCFANLGEALAPFGWVVGTSARQGRQRRLITNPRKMVEELVPKLAANRVALVFGPEDHGLTNADLKFCNTVVTVPTADFSSLNLAQAVAILTYELYSGVLQANKSGEAANRVKLAQSRELENMYAHIGTALQTMNFLKESEYDYWLHNIRNFLGRIGLRSREVRFIRGFCKHVEVFAEKKRGSVRGGNG